MVELPDVQAPTGSVRDNGIFAAPAAALRQQAPAWPYELSSASLLAAGVLVALGRRRREQLWRRAFGRRIAGPDPDAALAETALRLGADDPAVRMLDTGLRYLSRQLAARDKTPPTVFAAHLGQENLDLWIAPPDQNPPRPWQAADGGQVWRLPFAAISGLDAPEAGAAPGTLAPYPGLVSLGTNSSGRILVDLEVAHGLIAVRGPRAVVQAALSALAVELVTNRWSDQMQVTLIGFGDGLAEISPERVRVLPHPRRGPARAGEARGGGQERDGRGGTRLGADRPVTHHGREPVGAALPDHGRAADARPRRSGCSRWPGAGTGWRPAT